MPVEALSLERVRDVYDVNVFGLLSLTKACLPAIRHSHGRIINIGSVSGQVATVSGATYSGTKFAVEGITVRYTACWAPASCVGDCVGVVLRAWFGGWGMVGLGYSGQGVGGQVR